MNALSVSWKTTVGGLLTSIGAALLGASQALDLVTPPALLWVGYIYTAIGPVLLGTSARDASKSSQDHGIR